MRELKEAIAAHGVGIGTDIVKVDSFLNHRIDTKLITAMGRYIADAFAGDRPDIVLTVESSGIAIALAAAQALGGIPVVFGRKSQSRNVGPDVYTAQVYSFTRQVTNTIRVSRVIFHPQKAVPLRKGGCRIGFFHPEADIHGFVIPQDGSSCVIYSRSSSDRINITKNIGVDSL